MSFIKRSPLFAKHLEARRASARKSTGPHTPEGKERQELENRIRDFKLRTRPVPDSGDDRDKTNPMGLTYALSIRWEDLSQNKPKMPILLAFNWIQLNSARFLTNMNAENKPKRLNIWPVNQIGGFRPKQTQASYLPWNLSVTAKMGPLFSKFKCGTVRSIKDCPFFPRLWHEPEIQAVFRPAALSALKGQPDSRWRSLPIAERRPLWGLPPKLQFLRTSRGPEKAGPRYLEPIGQDKRPNPLL